MPAQTACQKVLKAYARRDFADWRGLPADCTVDEVLHVFNAQDEWIGSGNLGLDAVSANYRYCLVPSFNAPVRVWFVPKRVLQLEAENPPDDLTTTALESALGEPLAKLDSYFGVALIEQNEWVYPERGIAFNTQSEGTGITRLCVFAPTTLESYRHKIRLNVRQRPMPEARPN